MPARRRLVVLGSALAFALLLCAQSALAATYYVSPKGSNNNAGTSATAPWQTIARVNQLTYKPGDSILFQGGASFTGSLYMAPASAGTAISPITVGSYGTGRATINPGASDAFYAYDNGGFQLSNLNFVGSGASSNSSSGVLFYNDLAGNVKEPHIYLSNLTVSGFGQQGISIGGWNGSSGYTGVNLTSVTASGNGLNGIDLYGEANYANANVYIGSATAHDNLGKAGLANNSGSGIVLGSVNGGTVESSTAYDNGQNNTATTGPVGIWAYDSNAVVIQHCQSYSNHTNGGDGDGFDLDINTTNSTIQYSYSHNNDGAGFLLDQNTADNNWSSNTLRYDVSENDGRKISFGGITLYGRVYKAEVYGNTVYNATAPAGTGRAVYIFNSGAPAGAVPSSVHFRNNIFDVAGTSQLVNAQSSALAGAGDLLFQGNDYFTGTAPVQIAWGKSTYGTLAGWRSGTAEEMLSGTSVGRNVDPQLVNPGGGGTPGQLTAMTAYELQSGSPLQGAGLDMAADFGVDPGPIDFWGNGVPTNGPLSVGGYQ